MSAALNFPKVLYVNEPDPLIRALPHDDRPSVKLLTKGSEALSDAELISIFLQRGRKGQSAVDQARDIMTTSGSLSGVLSSPELLVRPDQRARLEGVLELARRVLREQINRGVSLNSPQGVRDYLRLKLQDRPHEVFMVVFLDAQNRVLAVEEMFRGTLTQTSVYPREVVKRALLHNAAAVIFAHNHPSGVAEPSRADESLTQALKQALALVDVKVLDHFVVGANSAMSFAERGLL